MGIVLLELYLGEKPWGDFTDLNDLFVMILSFSPKKYLENTKQSGVRVWGSHNEHVPGRNVYDRLKLESMDDSFRRFVKQIII